MQSLEWRAALGRPYIEFKADGTTAQNGSFRFCPSEARLARTIILTRGGRHYFGGDINSDGIVEDSRGKNLGCD